MTPPKAMILAAGRGRRLRPWTDRMPKPLVSIGGRSLIVHQLLWLRCAGVRDVVINLHHLGEQIEAVVGDGRNFGVRVRYSREDELLETGGGVRKALPLLRPGPFLVLNGDVWTDYPFENLLFQRPRQAHLVLTPKPAHKPHADFHFVDGAGRGRPAVDNPGGAKVARNPALDDLTYCGIAVLTEALFAHSAAGVFSLRDLYFEAAAQGDLTGERFDGVWIDIGTPEQMRRALRVGAHSTGGLELASQTRCPPRNLTRVC